MWPSLKIVFSGAKQSIKEWRFDKENALPISESTEQEIVQEIKKNGFYVLEKYWDAKKCDQAAEQILHLKKSEKQRFKVDDQMSDFRFFGIQDYGHIFQDFFSDPYLKKIGESYLGYKINNYFTLANHTVCKENNLGSGGGWHRDSGFTRQFKALMYLTDMTQKNGAFECCERSHGWYNSIKYLALTKKDNHFRFTDQNIQSSDLNIKKLVAPKGSVILVDTQCIHRGSPILEGERMALTNYYVGQHRRTEFHSYFKDIDQSKR